QPAALWSCASTCMFGTRGAPFFVLTAKQAQCSRRVIGPIAAFVAGSTENRREGPPASLDMSSTLLIKLHEAAILLRARMAGVFTRPRSIAEPPDRKVDSLQETNVTRGLHCCGVSRHRNNATSANPIDLHCRVKGFPVVAGLLRLPASPRHPM